MIFDSSLSLALAAVTTSETQKGDGGDNLKVHPLATQQQRGGKALVFSNEILSLEQHETGRRALPQQQLRDALAASAVCNSG